MNNNIEGFTKIKKDQVDNTASIHEPRYAVIHDKKLIHGRSVSSEAELV